MRQRNLREASGTTISTQTVRNRLHDAGFRARRPAVRVPLIGRHRQERLQCCQLSTANDNLPRDVSVVVQRYSWRVDCVYLLRMLPLLRSFSTMDLCATWIGQLDFELSAMLVYTSAELRDSACLE